MWAGDSMSCPCAQPQARQCNASEHSRCVHYSMHVVRSLSVVARTSSAVVTQDPAATGLGDSWRLRVPVGGVGLTELFDSRVEVVNSQPIYIVRTGSTA